MKIAKFAFVIVLFASLGLLIGCSTIDLGDPNRPLPTQPQVSADIMAQLSARSLKSTPIFIGNTVYYDASLVKTKKEGKINFTKDFPKLDKPTTDVIETAYGFIGVFKGHLQSDGFTVVNEACDSCLRLDVDFASVTIKEDTPSPVIVMFFRARIFFKGVEVITGDDVMAGARQGILSPKGSAKNEANKVGAFGFTNQLERAWRIAIRSGGQVQASVE
ncbi:MAG: hypothetical protein Q7S34_01230 [bacterium]|nr:hypothetical protein [bacterium]